FDPGARCLLLRDLVELEGEVPAKDIEGLRATGPRTRSHLRELDRHLLHIAGTHRCFYGSDVHGSAGLRAVNPVVARHWCRVIELKNEVPVAATHFLGSAAKLRRLPGLALVLSEVLNDEGFDALQCQQSLARGVDGKPSQVRGDPAAPELLGDCGGRTGADEAIQYEVIRLR